MRYGMVIDLRRCIGCYACVIACKAENCTPPGIFFGRLLSREEGKYPSAKRIFLPLPCMHCGDPACEKVCPTGATVKREDGIVTIDETKCFGCRYCMMACPYGSRFFYNEEFSYFPNGAITPHQTIGGNARRDWNLLKGTTVKCTFCSHRIDSGIRKGLKPGVDREATPACVITCITKASSFGDLDDPTSEISRLIRTRSGFQFRPEAGTDPSVYYLPP